MMLSESKKVLWACALVAGAGALLSIVLSGWVLFGGRRPPSFELLTVSLIFLSFLCSLAAVLAATELRGFLAGAAVMFCLSLPVIVSAARMEGGYGD